MKQQHSSSDSEKSVESDNDIYDLLEAEQLSNQPASVAAGLAFAEGKNDSSPSSENSFNNNSSISQEAFREVYRSVSARELGEQHMAALHGTRHLDQPLDMSPIALAPGTNATWLKEPEPRTFTMLPVSHSHLYVRKEFRQLATLLEMEMEKANVDVAYDAGRYEWRAAFYPKNGQKAVNLSVHINSCPEIGSDRFLLEFVRLNGCAMAFFQLFSNIKQAFQREQIVTKANGDFFTENDTQEEPEQSPFRLTLSRSSSSSSSAGFQPIQIMDFEEDENDTDLDSVDIPDAELYRPLVELLSVSFVDTHVQGLALVAGEAQQDAKRMLDACPDVLDLIANHFRETTHAEVRRLCCTSLAVFAQLPSCMQAILSLVPKLAEVAASNLTVTSAETQRQAATCLLNLVRVTREGSEERTMIAQAVQVHEEAFARLAKTKDKALTACISAVTHELFTNY